MELSDEDKRAFLLLKGVCDSLVKCPSKQHPYSLDRALREVGSSVATRFAPYILYPIKLRIFNKDFQRRDDVCCILLDCVFIVIRHLQLSDPALFLEIYSIICYSLVGGGSQEDQTKIKESSEELKVKAVNCCKELFTYADSQLLDSLYSDKHFFSKTSVIIFNTLQFASKQKSTSLRIASLECLLVVCRLSDVTSSSKTYLSLDSAKFLKRCLPGVVAECRAIVSQAQTINHRITQLALRVWSRSVCMVLADRHRKVKVDDDMESLKLVCVKRVMESGRWSDTELSADGELSDEWVRWVADKLVDSTCVLVSVAHHSHYRVRLELVSAVLILLTHSPQNMRPSLGKLLDALIVLSEDSDENVVSASKQALDMFRNSWIQGRSLVEDVKECFLSLLNRLPRVLHSTDENVKESEMRLLCGYMELLGPQHFADFIESHQLLNKLIDCLLEAALLDDSHISLLQQSPIADVGENCVKGPIVWRRYSLCLDPKLGSRLEKVFVMLANLPTLVDIAFALTDRLTCSSLKRKELILLTNHILLSSPQLSGSARLSKLIRSVLDLYVEDSGRCFSDLQLTPSQLRTSLLQHCLYAEGIGRLCQVLGGDQFSVYMLDSLFRLLQYSGSPYDCLAQAGFWALQSVAAVYGCETVGGLIQLNMDYLSHGITVGLRALEVNSDENVLHVLSALISNSTLSTLPSLLHVMKTVLADSCRKGQRSKYCLSYLHVFKCFLSSLHKWLIQDKHDRIQDRETQQSLVLMVFQYQSHKNISDNLDSSLLDDKCEDEEVIKGDEDECGDKKEEVPEYVSVTRDILCSCSHYLPSKQTKLQIDALQIMEKGCLIMMNHKDVLLPVIHRIWSPLVERFHRSNHPLTIRQAFSLLLTLAYVSNDFVRQRTVKQVLPELCGVLERLSKESRCKSAAQAYGYSHNYKLQLEILQGLGNLSIDLQLSGREIHSLLTATQPYLSSYQPLPLQRACMDVYLKLSQLNDGVVWLHLLTLSPQLPNSIVLPERLLSFIKNQSDKEEYGSDAAELMGQLMKPL